VSSDEVFNLRRRGERSSTAWFLRHAYFLFVPSAQRGDISSDWLRVADVVLDRELSMRRKLEDQSKKIVQMFDLIATLQSDLAATRARCNELEQENQK